MAEDKTTIKGAAERITKFLKDLKLYAVLLYITVEILGFDVMLQLFRIFNNPDDYIDTHGTIIEGYDAQTIGSTLDTASGATTISSSTSSTSSTSSSGTRIQDDNIICINSSIHNMFFKNNEGIKLRYLATGALIFPLISSISLYLLLYKKGFAKSEFTTLDDILVVIMLIFNTLYIIMSVVIGIYLSSGTIRERKTNPNDQNNYIYGDDDPLIGWFESNTTYGLCMNDSCGTNYLTINTLVNLAFGCKILTLMALITYIIMPDTKKAEQVALITSEEKENLQRGRVLGKYGGE